MIIVLKSRAYKINHRVAEAQRVKNKCKYGLNIDSVLNKMTLYNFSFIVIPACPESAVKSFACG